MLLSSESPYESICASLSRLAEEARCAVSEPEHVQHRGVALLAQFRRVDEAVSGDRARTGHDRDILLAIDLEGHRRRREARADIDLPHLFERSVVMGGDRAVEHGHEYEPAAGHQRARV